MKKEISFSVPPEVAFDPDKFQEFVLAELNLPPGAVVRQARRSIDARGRNVKVNVMAEVFENGHPTPLTSYQKDYPNVARSPQAIVVGCGPAGMFAALRLVELGIKPIIIERGKDVRARRRDLAAINKDHIVNPESNYCFGEGGAGTYSDGKLYTRSKKRGDFRRLLEIFVAHGASPEILVDAHPHIGTNKLPQIVANIRQSILDAGGEILFNSKVTGFMVSNQEMTGVTLENGDKIDGIGVILATGHSARDIFYTLQQQDILIEAKPFALGVRVEHSQNLIDQIQYKTTKRGEYLPAAPYSLVSQTNYQGKQKGVFSFCMCPGGFIVPSATAPGEIVVNGMSPSRRDSRFANSGIVVPVDEEDLLPYQKHGAFAGLAFQQAVEQKTWEMGGKTQTAPAQLLGDFIKKKVSHQLLDCSYQPGLVSVSMDEVLPKQIIERLRLGFQEFGKKMRGYLNNGAQIIAVESRTSSPIRIPRDRETLQHVRVQKFYPCGEGAGYAGGIASAAMDGERCAEKLAGM